MLPKLNKLQRKAIINKSILTLAERRYSNTITTISTINPYY